MTWPIHTGVNNRCAQVQAGVGRARHKAGFARQYHERPAPMPNTLIFVDMPSDDPAAAGRFYAEVFGWQNDEKPAGVYHRMVPGGQFPNPDGSDSQIGNLHLGIFDAANARGPIPTSPASRPAPSRDGRSRASGS
jgi:hypothetical protein